MRNKISVLYCEPGSIYHKLNCDVWDLKRNALLFNLPIPVIAHPPCRLWSRLHKFSTAPQCEKLTAISALVHIRKYGGVLEHPAGSSLFKKFGIRLDGNLDHHGGFVRSVNQFWFGHRAQKKTYLYICGISPGELPAPLLSFNAITHTISSSKRSSTKKEVNKSEKNATPIEFAKYLISIINLINEKQA
jgi:hypothetical protein